MLCKNGESIATTRVICKALNLVAEKYTGKKLAPAACNMDCSDAFRAGVLIEWPMTSERANPPKSYCPVSLTDFGCCVIGNALQESSPAGLTSTGKWHVESTSNW